MHNIDFKRNENKIRLAIRVKNRFQSEGFKSERRTLRSTGNPAKQDWKYGVMSDDG